MGSVVEVFGVALRLGLTSFGGPVAHIGYFRDEYVTRRRWIDEATFADLVALSQSLPGPASSKVGIAIGILRAGLPGGLASWLGFTAPSAIALVVFALGVQSLGPEADGWLHGLKVVAVAVVALAVIGMARTLVPDRLRAVIAIGAAVAVLGVPQADTGLRGAVQILALIAGGVLGWRFLRGGGRPVAGHAPRVPIGRRTAAVAAILYAGLLVVLPIARQASASQPIATFDAFYRTGALVFGGGHVVLPLLDAEVVDPGWISEERFVAGYGAAQAIPGPLFAFSAFVGAAMSPAPNGIGGAVLALGAIFLPGFLLTVATLPGFGAIRGRADVQAALLGVGAGVVGILMAALYNPVATSAIERPIDLGLALAAFGALAVWRLPPWLVVLVTAAAGAALQGVGQVAAAR